jgi:AI-2 transport protein TqsA
MGSSSKFQNIVITIAGILAILLVMRYAQDIVVPFLLSLFIAIIMSTPIDFLYKRGVSVPIAVCTVLGLTILLEVTFGVILGNTVAQFSEVLPMYQERISTLENQAGAWLLTKGINISDTGILDSLDPKIAFGFANSIMLEIGNVLSNVALISFTVFFLLLEAWSFPAKLNAMKGVQAGEVLANISIVIESTKQYIAMKTLASLATAILVGIGLALVGLDFVMLWVFLVFVLNFVPNIGSIIAAVPAILLSLLQLSPINTLIVIAIYLGANILIGSIIEPGIMGRKVGLSTLVVFLSLVFWGWVLGPVGMLLSVPLTMVIKFTALSSEKSHWLAVLLGAEPQENNHDIDSNCHSANKKR